jgi:predicted nucleotidyltransferase
MGKGHLLQIIKEILQADGRTVFAYAYGSFITQETFSDIDVGIFVKNAGENPLVISSDIKTQLSCRAKKEGLRLTADEFDVRILNDAPFTFLKMYLLQLGFLDGLAGFFLAYSYAYYTLLKYVKLRQPDWDRGQNY